MKMTKRLGRTPEQQEYRDNLAHQLNKLRQYGDAGKDLAKTLLDNEKGGGEVCGFFRGR